MKAKEFLQFDFSPWNSIFDSDVFGPGLDSLTLSKDDSEIGITIRDDDNGLCIEWVSDDDGDQLFFIKNDTDKSAMDVFLMIKDTATFNQ